MTERISRDRTAAKILLPMLLCVLIFMTALSLMTGVQRTAPWFVLIPAACIVPTWVAWRATGRALLDRVDMSIAGLTLFSRGRRVQLAWTRIERFECRRGWRSIRIRVHLQAPCELGDEFEFVTEFGVEEIRRRMPAAAHAKWVEATRPPA